jgi:hypothetical protein
VPRSRGADPRLGIVVTQKDEGELLRSHVHFHLQREVAGIVIVDNDSTDPDTLAVLDDLEPLDRVVVRRDRRPDFDQEALANDGLAILTSVFDVEWVMSLDVDEFLHTPSGLSNLLATLVKTGMPYHAVALANNLPDRATIAGVTRPAYLGTTLFYHPEMEREWQELGHLAKAICQVHDGMRVAVGNHFFYHEPLQHAFPGLPYGPVAVPSEMGCLLHYEMRDAGPELLQKWSNLASRHRVPGALPMAPWWEKRDRMLRQFERFANDPMGLYKYVVVQRRTLWGTSILDSRLWYCADVGRAVRVA